MEDKTPSKNVLTGGILVVLAMVIFGSYGLLVRFINADAILLVWSLQIVGVICFLVYLLKNRALLNLHKMFLRILLMTVFIVIADLSYFMALRTTTVSTAVFVKFLMPVIVIALTFRKSGISFKKLLFMVTLGIAGLLFILWPQGIPFSANMGILWSLITAFTLGSYLILFKKISATVPVTTILFYRYAIASVIVLPFILFIGNVFDQIGAFWPWLIGFGLLYAVIGTLIHMQGLKMTKVQYTAILGYVEPFAATVMSIVFLGETLTPFLIAGGILILSASTLSLKD